MWSALNLSSFHSFVSAQNQNKCTSMSRVLEFSTKFTVHINVVKFLCTEPLRSHDQWLTSTAVSTAVSFLACAVEVWLSIWMKCMNEETMSCPPLSLYSSSVTTVASWFWMMFVGKDLPDIGSLLKIKGIRQNVKIILSLFCQRR